MSNRQFSNCKGRHFATVQSLKDKKITPHLQELVLSPQEWHISNQDNPVTHFTDEAAKVCDKVFIKNDR